MPFEAPLLRPVQFRHDGFGVHAAGEHMAMIAVARDGLIAFHRRHPDTGNDSFLADVEMAKAANQAHAIHLPGFFLEAPDEQHIAIGG